MSASDLNPPIRKAKTAATMAACLAFVAAGQVSAAGSPVTATAMAVIAIPADVKNAGSDRASFDDRFAAALQTAAVASPVTPAVATSQPVDIAPPPRQALTAAGETIVGIASTYNPEDPADLDAGNQKTASGERYDAEDWTAAIRTDLRQHFGGVRYGRNYQPAFALVEAGGKSFIVRINDVGPLRPGRIIDLNVRSMRHVDPTMQLGLIADVKVTPLAGKDWALGPVTDPQPVTVASR